MWPFKEQVVSDEVKAIAKDIDDNPSDWGYNNLGQFRNKRTGFSMWHSGGFSSISVVGKSAPDEMFKKVEKKLLMVSMDKHILSHALKQKE